MQGQGSGTGSGLTVRSCPGSLGVAARTRQGLHCLKVLLGLGARVGAGALAGPWAQAGLGAAHPLHGWNPTACWVSDAHGLLQFPVSSQVCSDRLDCQEVIRFLEEVFPFMTTVSVWTWQMCGSLLFNTERCLLLSCFSLVLSEVYFTDLFKN